ncbi:hypothetical protein N9073_02395 [Akkermansiaceae bacterium]|nr:hypothetical protein [Akkermansiaceae bacterium]MDA7540392.1 hypothetical protein [bacterium]MDA7521962.1 hypothetical protein [Akkermansiaceae bacterium]MDA7526940.1 hypothetical protein [Akkermansiaceae bacterium]MDA7531470.1 hypothetical protein [Akkermansiaceae bacterium]
MAAPKKITEPHKELRFTRAGQAQGFIVMAAVSFAFFLLIGLTWFMGHPTFTWWMALPFLILSALLTRLSAYCARHAYLILTPLGMEIFPLIKPHKNLNLVYWAQIIDADFNEELTALKLHFNEDQTAGIILSLKAISAKKRLLLKRALESRLAEKKG